MKIIQTLNIMSNGSCCFNLKLELLIACLTIKWTGKDLIIVEKKTFELNLLHFCIVKP